MKPEPKAEPVEAWKDLVLAYTPDNGLHIEGPAYKQQKYTLEGVKAQCFSGTSYQHECPDPVGKCYCGFNAWKSRNKTDVAKYSLDFRKSSFPPAPSRTGSIDVLAKVLLYGRVVEYQKGYRAEYQDIEAIEVPDVTLKAFVEMHGISVMEVRNTLQCDIIPVETKWINKGQETSLKLKFDKNDKPYVYQGFSPKFNKAVPNRQPQLRAATFHFNPDTLTISVFESWQVQQKRSEDGELVYPCSARRYVYRHGVWLRKYRGKFICIHDPSLNFKADGTKLSTKDARTKEQNAVPKLETRSKKVISEALELLEPYYSEKIEKFQNQEALRYMKRNCKKRLIRAGVLEDPRTPKRGSAFSRDPALDGYSSKAVCVCGEHEGDKIISLNS